MLEIDLVALDGGGVVSRIGLPAEIISDFCGGAGRSERKAGFQIAAAYLKKGMSFAAAGKKDEAVSAYRLLISKYPLEEETRIAQQKLKELLEQ